MPLNTTPTLHWKNPLIWIGTAGTFCCLLLLSLVLGISLLFPLVVAFGAFSLILLFRAPLLLLSLLFIVRMSLDYSSQYISLSLWNITLSLSQLLGLGIAFLGIIFIVVHFQKLLRFPLLVPFLIVTLWGLFTLTYSISPSATTYELLRFFNLFVIAFR